jgi:hypothetical protein
MATQQAGPDFFCIGAQKGGTGWLYDQLRAHPDFWMPPMKEIHYFERLNKAAENLPERSLPYARTESDRLEVARTRARDERDRGFLDDIEKLFRQSSVDLENYARLFKKKGELLSGDITPGYSILSDDSIAEIARHFPAAKVIFLARDPVERAWSQLSMYVRRGLIKPFDLDDEDQVAQHLRRPEVLLRSRPSEIVARWRRHVPPELFAVYFFDDLKSDAVAMRRAIIAFLGGDPAKPSGRLSPDYNAKARKERLSLHETMQAYLARFFEEELKACATELGGAARKWPARYGL